MTSPLRWPGGKGRLAEVILGYLPPHKAYVETCCGGAAVFWAKPKDASEAEILNDRDGELINFYAVLHRHGRRLARELDGMPYSRRLFGEMLRSRPRSMFKRALRFWYINRVGFGAIGRTFGVLHKKRPYVIPRRVLAGLDATIERLRGVVFEALDVVRLVELYDRSIDVLLCGSSVLRRARTVSVRFRHRGSRPDGRCPAPSEGAVPVELQRPSCGSQIIPGMSHHGRHHQVLPASGLGDLPEGRFPVVGTRAIDHTAIQTTRDTILRYDRIIFARSA